MPDNDDPRVSLLHVLPVGVELNMPGGYQLFLLALYLWDDHFVVSYATTEPPVPRRPGQTMFEDWTAEDDLGRRYQAVRGGGGGGHLQLMRRSFVPALDDAASRLTLTLTDWDKPLLQHSVALPQ